MQIMNDILSNDIGYLHAPRHAQPLPKPVVIPQKPLNSKKAIVMICIVGFGAVAIILVFKFLEDLEEKRSKKDKRAKTKLY